MISFEIQISFTRSHFNKPRYLSAYIRTAETATACHCILWLSVNRSLQAWCLLPCNHELCLWRPEGPEISQDIPLQTPWFGELLVWVPRGSGLPREELGAVSQLGACLCSLTGLTSQRAEGHSWRLAMRGVGGSLDSVQWPHSRKEEKKWSQVGPMMTLLLF